MNQTEYSAKLKEYQEQLKPSEARYIPSGATPPPSIALLIPACLFVVAFCYAITVPICLLFYEMAGSSSGDGAMFSRWQEGRWIALWIIIVNLIILIVIAFLTVWSFKFVAYVTKLRNPKIAQRFAFFTVFLVCAGLYLPLFRGQSLAPTAITILFIPVSWVLMIVGCLVVPFLVSFAVEGVLGEMKFCEKTGRFLRKVAHTTLSWEQGKSLTSALSEKNYGLLPQVMTSEGHKRHNPGVTFSLFGHPRAEVAYIDVRASFEAVIGDATNPTHRSWLVYHQRLSQEEANYILNALPPSAKPVPLV